MDTADQYWFYAKIKYFGKIFISCILLCNKGICTPVLLAHESQTITFDVGCFVNSLSRSVFLCLASENVWFLHVYIMTMIGHLRKSSSHNLGLLIGHVYHNCMSICAWSLVVFDFSTCDLMMLATWSIENGSSPHNPQPTCTACLAGFYQSSRCSVKGCPHLSLSSRHAAVNRDLKGLVCFNLWCLIFEKSPEYETAISCSPISVNAISYLY